MGSHLVVVMTEPPLARQYIEKRTRRSEKSYDGDHFPCQLSPHLLHARIHSGKVHPYIPSQYT